MPSEKSAQEALDPTLEKPVAAAEESADNDAPEAVQPAASDMTLAGLTERLAQAEQAAARNLDGWQRALADFANARRRMDKQLSEAYVNARVEIATRLLPGLDDLALAMGSVPEAVARSEWYTGLQLVERKFNSILEAIQIERIPAVGQPFDPTYHEAIMQEDSAEFADGIIIRELQVGYKIGDRVLRPSLVCVAA